MHESLPFSFSLAKNKSKEGMIQLLLDERGVCCRGPFYEWVIAWKAIAAIPILVEEELLFSLKQTRLGQDIDLASCSKKGIAIEAWFNLDLEVEDGRVKLPAPENPQAFLTVFAQLFSLFNDSNSLCQVVDSEKREVSFKPHAVHFPKICPFSLKPTDSFLLLPVAVNREGISYFSQEGLAYLDWPVSKEAFSMVKRQKLQQKGLVAAALMGHIYLGSVLSQMLPLKSHFALYSPAWSTSFWFASFWFASLLLFTWLLLFSFKFFKPKVQLKADLERETVIAIFKERAYFFAFIQCNRDEAQVNV